MTAAFGWAASARLALWLSMAAQPNDAAARRTNQAAANSSGRAVAEREPVAINFPQKSLTPRSARGVDADEAPHAGGRTYTAEAVRARRSCRHGRADDSTSARRAHRCCRRAFRVRREILSTPYAYRRGGRLDVRVIVHAAGECAFSQRRSPKPVDRGKRRKPCSTTSVRSWRG